MTQKDTDKNEVVIETTDNHQKLQGNQEDSQMEAKVDDENIEVDIEEDIEEDTYEEDTFDELALSKENIELKEKVNELEDRVLRLQAEMNNIQKRNARERSIAAKYMSQKLATSLLEVIDNFERALDTETKSEDALALKQGLEMVHKQFLNAFEKENIQVIDPLGQEFDPNYHQAMSLMPGGEEYPSNTIINVLQKGYQLEDRILRPAMVIVAE